MLLPSSLLAIPLIALASASVVERIPASQHGKLIRRDGGTGIVEADFINPPNWAITAIIGGQEMKLLVDTGSSTLWVFGTDLPATEAQNHHQLYDIKKSPTAKVVQGPAGTFQQAYQNADDYLSGFVVLETVQIGGATVQDQAIGVATEIGAGELADGGFSGIIGFDFSSQDTIGNGAPTWFDNLSRQQNTTSFAVDLRNDTSGQISFGTTDSSRYIGSLNRIPIVNETQDGVFWTTPNVTYDIGGKAVNAPPADLLLDTGGAYTALPLSIVKAYWSGVSGSVDQSHGNGTTWTFSCTATLPDLTIHFQNTTATATIPGILFNAGSNATGDSQTCLGALAYDPGASGLPTAGDAFFLSQYVVFDVDGPTASFAPQKNLTIDEVNVPDKKGGKSGASGFSVAWFSVAMGVVAGVAGILAL